MSPANPFTPSCAVPACRNPVTVRGRCATHASQQDRQRTLTSDRYHAHLYQSARWQRLRLQILKARPLCECPDCRGGQLHVTVADVVHHVHPHGGDPIKFFDPANLLPLAKSCHDRLTGQRRSTPAGGQ